LSYRLFQPIDSARRRLLTSARGGAPLTDADRRGLLVAKIFYFVFWGALGCIAPFFNIYLARQGLSGVQIGWLGSVAPLIALIANPFWGAIADRWQVHTLILALCTLAAGLISLLFIPVTGFWPLMVVVILLFFFRSPIPAIADSAVMGIVTRTGRSYGRQRMWGSLGFVVASYGLGLVVTMDNLDLIFWLQGLLLGVVLFVLAFLLPIERFGGRVNILAGVRTLGKQPSYIGFLLAMVLSGMGSAGYINFLGLHVLDLGGSGAQIGLAFAASAATEIPVMFLGARWFGRYANATLVTVGLGIFFLSWLLVGFAPTPAAVIGAVLFVGIGFGTFWVAAVGFASERAPAGMGATAQATLGAFQSGLGWGLGAILAGFVWDWAGGSAVLWTSATLALAALLVFRVGLRVESRGGRSRIPA